MRIAQIAPLAESVPPKLYGGTERVVAWLVVLRRSGTTPLARQFIGSTRELQMTESHTQGMSRDEAQAAEALRSAAESATREPTSTRRTSERLVHWTRQAPLAALMLAVLAGYLTTRRR